jgi:rod shape determining protein RodA
MPVAPKMHAKPSDRFGLAKQSKLKSALLSMNYPLLIVTAVLICYGLLVVWTATAGSTKYSFSHQIFGVVVGLVLMIVIWRFDYRKISSLAMPLLIGTLVLILLPLVPFLGVSVNGARSWISIFGQQFQPGELAKIADILYMAALISRYKGRIDSGSEYLKCFGLMMIPVVAIMAQPDLGTGMVLFVIGMAVLFAGGANRRWLLITVAIVAAVIVFALATDSALDAAFGNDVFIKDYQKDRLLVFINPDIDPDGVGYNLKQAQIAIGSGGFLGKGIGNATQSGLGFLPEAPTDFVFCVLAEQFGFLGSITLLLLYAGLLLLVLRVAFNAFDLYGTLAVTGILGMWIFQILENIGMTCGLMPITGIPLPFISYGTSFMLVNFIVLGLVFSIWAHRDPTGAR